MSDDFETMTSVSSEKSLLGGFLLRNDAISWVNVSTRSFYDSRCRHVYSAMSKLASEGKPIDEVTLEVELRDRGYLEAVGGLPFLSELAMFVPTADNIAHYAAIVEEKRVAREVYLLCSEMRSRVKRDKPDDVISEFMARLSSIDTGADEATHIYGDVVAEEFKGIFSEIEGEQTSHVESGLIPFDASIGGLPRGVPTLIGARPGVGKSTLALQMALAMSHDDQASAVFTYEDRAKVWAQRGMSEKASVPLPSIRRREFTREQLQRVGDAAEHLRNVRNLAIVHAHGWKMQRVIRRARALVRQLGVRVVWLDYMQLVPSPDHKIYRRKVDIVTENLRMWAQFVGEEDIAGPILWQLTREFAARGTEPVDRDFADSSSAEQYGKLNLALWEPPSFDGDLQLCVVKNSNGPTGNFRLPFNKENMRIEGFNAT